MVVRFDFSDQPPHARHVWLLVNHGDAEVCKHHPGFDEDLIVETGGMTFARWHLKDLEWANALGSVIRVTGPRLLARALPTWNRRGFQSQERYEEARVG